MCVSSAHSSPSREVKGGEPLIIIRWFHSSSNVGHPRDLVPSKVLAGLVALLLSLPSVVYTRIYKF